LRSSDVYDGALLVRTTNDVEALFSKSWEDRTYDQGGRQNILEHASYLLRSLSVFDTIARTLGRQGGSRNTWSYWGVEIASASEVGDLSLHRCRNQPPALRETRLASALKPSLVATRAIGSGDVFGDHAFKVSVDTCLEEGSTLSSKLLTELNRTPGIGTKKTLQHWPPFYEWSMPYVVTLNMEKIEGVHDNVLRTRPDRRLQPRNQDGVWAVQYRGKNFRKADKAAMLQ
jgi:hypothetical protein